MSWERLFPDVCFVHVVSLGGDSQAAQVGRAAGWLGNPDLFDWVVTPLDAIPRILADDGARLGTDFIAAHEGTAVRCGAYGVLYQHEFPQDDTNGVVFTPDALTHCRTTLASKMAAFLESCIAATGPVLFIRFGIKTDMPTDRSERGQRGFRAIDALAASLTSRFPSLDFRLLVAMPEGDLPANPGEWHDTRVKVVSLPKQGSDDEAGHTASWRALPAQIAFIERRGHRGDVKSSTPKPVEITVGCVSLAKTGSMALTDAMRGAGFPTAVHLHWLGPQATAIKRAAPDTMLDRAIEVAGRLHDPHHTFRFVTSVRDPIARILSWAFHVAEQHLTRSGIEIREPEALIAWWEAQSRHPLDVWSAWFDDTFKTTFGFDFRKHQFDRTRKSLRFSNDRLRLLVLRQEDPRAGKETELRWLLDREVVTLRSINDAASQGHEPTYRPFLNRFVAPVSWLDTYYESDVIRHFYSEDERNAFRARWSGATRRAAPTGGAKIGSLKQDATTKVWLKALPRTVACLSMHKTGSMALTTAIQSAGFREVLHSHQVGPRSVALRNKRATERAEMGATSELAAKIADPEFALALVTCVRDPIAQLISTYFQFASTQKNVHGNEMALAHDDFVAWRERNFALDYSTWWFDDNFRTTLNFDFRMHPFDHESRSLRYDSTRLRLLCLRCEDPTGVKEAALGWLVGRDRVALPRVNVTAEKKDGGAYRDFVATFSAPPPWIDEFYETDLIRHFYTEEERDAFRARWSGAARRGMPAGGANSELSTHDTTAQDWLKASHRTVACLSMMKTGSTAILTALREADPGCEVVHLHHLGPLARARFDPLGRPVEAVAKLLDDPDHRFVIATCVREPMARLISQAFHDAQETLSRTGNDIVRDTEALVAWMETKKMLDYSTEWFDDSFLATFGFNFRSHPFDHARGSLRFESDRLRLLVLRQDDPIASKEVELGWLLKRDRVAIPQINETLAGPYGDRYRAFLETFVAPDSWLDTLYETDLARHFYTEDERAGFRRRWGRANTKMSARPSPAASLTHRHGKVSPGVPAMPVPEKTERSSVSVAEYEQVNAELMKLRARLRDGHAVDFNDYVYRPRERDWSNSLGAKQIVARLDATKDAYLGLLERFCGFDVNFRKIPVLPDGEGPYWENWWLPGLDAAILYGLIATLAPPTYVEIGSGHSTRFVRQAIRDHALPTRIVSIDPNPTTEIDTLSDEVLRICCEDAPASIFAGLNAGDMLFFDGGHRSFQNSDTTVFFTEILPALAPGVIYGLHDIFLPYDYPDSWTTRFYNEQYLLMAYLLGGAAKDEIVFPAHHVSRGREYAHLRNRLFLGTKHLDWLTSSFWMRRAESP